MTVKDGLALQLIPILFNVIVLHHYNNHIYLIEELIKVQNLVLDNLLLSEERIKALQRTGKVTFLNINHLECGAFTNVIHIFL